MWWLRCSRNASKIESAAGTCRSRFRAARANSLKEGQGAVSKQTPAHEASDELDRHTRGGARPPGSVCLHPRAVRRVLPVAKGRRAIHRRPSRRGSLPNGGGASASREHVIEHGRSLLAGARI